MTEQRFIGILRDYAAVARRRNVSYAEPVRALVALRVAEIEKGGGDWETVAQRKAAAHAIAAREYGKFDAGFALPD